jgi:hypothetical protein
MLIDTGSARSFINPRIAEEYIEQGYATYINENFTVQTAHKTTTHQGKIILPPMQQIFGPNSIPLEFYIFNFSDKYDYLLGWDAMTKLQLSITPGQGSLNTADRIIPLFYTESTTTLDQIIKENQEVFAETAAETSFDKIKHRITLLKNEPVYQRPYRLPEVQRQEVTRQIKEMLSNKIIRPSDSPWSSPVHLVEKRTEPNKPKKWRLVIDYRKLNAQTRDDKFPLPNIEDIFSKLNGSRFFSTLDLTAGYHQINMDEDSIPLTAFSTPDGHYEYTRMPFGLKTAPATFQRMMNNVLRPHLESGKCLVFLDDVIIFAPNELEHNKRLQEVFDTLKRNKLRVNREKCKFLQTSVKFLGHILTKDGLQPCPDKISAINKFPLPNTVKEIKSFLGLVSYYRKFIPNLSRIVKPITMCTKKGSKIIHDESFKNAFNRAKELISNPPVLSYPDFDKLFTVTTDASDKALGAVISQDKHPIAYASRTLNETEQKYNTTEKELLGILYALDQFRPYIYGRKFKLETDHQPLTWIAKLKEPNSRLTRWRLKLQEYDYEIQYKKGATNYVADALSRIEINFNESTAATIHSNYDDSSTGFSIKHEHPPRRMNRIYVTQGTYMVKSELKTSGTYDYYLTLQNPEDFKKFLIEYCGNKRYAIICETNLGQNLSEVYRKNFNVNSLEIIWFKNIRKEITQPEEIHKIIRQTHEYLHRHLGNPALCKEISKEYYIENLKQHTGNFLKHCNICNQVKYDRKPINPPMEKTPTFNKPMEKWQLDTFNYEKNKYLTGIDLFSKWAFMIPLMENTGLKIIDELTKLFMIVGTPRIISTDNETLFQSEDIKQFFNMINIEQYTPTPQHHTSHADIERLHSTIIEKLRTQREVINKIDIPLALFAYNSTIHSTTSKTPNELHFLREINLPINDTITCDYLNDIKNKIQTVKDKTYARQNKMRQITIPELKVGLKFFIQKHDRGKNKNTFRGPYTIKEVKPRNKAVYTSYNRDRLIHMSQMKIPDVTDVLPS